MTVVVGVDGAGRSHRLDQIAAAAGLPVVRVDGRGELTPAAESVLATGTGEPGSGADRMLVVDDADRLDGPTLRRLAAAARSGVPIAISRRPTVDSPELAELDEAVGGAGAVEQVGPLDRAALAELVSGVLGRSADEDLLAEVWEESAGNAAVATALAAAAAQAPEGVAGVGQAGRPVPALAARVQQRLARLEQSIADLARVLALRLELPDEALSAAVDLDPSVLAQAVRRLRDLGLLSPDAERLIPAVARVVLADLSPAERRRLHDRVARALLAAGADPVAAATQLSAARARTAGAATVYRAAADRLRFTDPAAALAWYDDAVDAGAAPETVAAGRAEAAALLGNPVDVDLTDPGDPAGAARVARAAGAAAAHQGRAVRAAEALTQAPPPGPLLAAPVLISVGRRDRAATVTGMEGPAPVRRLAEAVGLVPDPAACVPSLIEAAEAFEAHPPELVLPDTPHAIGAVVAVTAGDVATAEYLLDRALATGVGGPVWTHRHRLLLAWARLRTGRFDTVPAELSRYTDAARPGREVLLIAALAAGIARRSGDIAQLRDAWAAAEPVLARRAVDLFALEPLEELLVAAARLRQQHRIPPVLDTLAEIVSGLGDPPAWTVSLQWIRLQIAVAGEDAAAAAEAAERITAAATAVPLPDATSAESARASELATGGEVARAGELATGGEVPAVTERQRAQAHAAVVWAEALAGQVDLDTVIAAADGLAGAQLPWEGSRLAGHAAIRTSDPAVARKLLERARLRTGPETGPAPVAEADAGGLSDREREVARLVLDGRTYREIGAQLYLSPKTVEHHVARIRTKLAATSRAELVAALRRIFGRPTAP